MTIGPACRQPAALPAGSPAEGGQAGVTLVAVNEMKGMVFQTTLQFRRLCLA